MRKPSFPAVVRRENVVVKIYRQVKKGRYPTFLVTYYDGSLRKRLPFSDYEEARREADDIADKLAAGDLRTLRRPRTHRRDYPRFRESAEHGNGPCAPPIPDFGTGLGGLESLGG